tara:strand:+ start:8313 stop:9017 length:705 start_codon:yes stop_codon:yes gene_type:complete
MKNAKPENGLINLNMDFSKKVILDTADLPWSPSSLSGVERRKLERQNAESGHATSIVRYAPGSQFSPHIHSGGEEYLVLEGVFSDETGDYGKGCYVRNPPGSRHTPSSQQGCTIFVKLCQMLPQGEPQINVDTNMRDWEPIKEGWFIMPLFENAQETVRLNKLQPDQDSGQQTYPRGMEILLLSGDLSINGEMFTPQTWGRFPPGAVLKLESTAGCTFWSKQGHLNLTDTLKTS